jgi:hypothetical protein
MNIGLFYGSSTCYTEMAAEKIRDIIGPELVTLHNLKDDAVALMEQYDVLILASQPGILVRYRKTGKPSGISSIQSISTAKSLPCTAWAISWVTGMVPGRARHAARQAGAERGVVYRLLANRRLRVHQ